LLQAELLALLMQNGAYVSTAESDRPHLLVEATKRVSADHANWLQAAGSESAQALLSPGHLQSLMQDYNPGAASAAATLGAAAASQGEDPGSSGFVVADRDGLVIACEMTMNRLFGDRRLIPGTGVILAAALGNAGLPLGPMLTLSPQRESVDFAATASGGSAGASTLIAVFLDSVLRGRPLGDALAAKRVHGNGAPDMVLYEDGTPEAVVAGLSQRGHAMQPSGPARASQRALVPGGTARSPRQLPGAADRAPAGRHRSGTWARGAQGRAPRCRAALHRHGGPRDANERAARGENVLHLEVGAPSTGAPRAVIEAASARSIAIAPGYTEALGIAPLRQRIARHYRDMCVSVDPARVIATTGSSGAFLLSFLAAFDPGDRVARRARLSRLPEHSGRARHHTGQSADRRGDAFSADARTLGPGRWPDRWIDRRQSFESGRHDDRRGLVSSPV
jgi:hypothetical protein